MSLEALPVLLNLASSLLAGSTAVFVALGVRNLKRTHDRTSRNDDSSKDLPAIGEELRVKLSSQLRLESKSTQYLPVLRPKRLVDDAQLSPAAADIGVADLEILLRGLIKATHRTPFLVGVNKGGALVANFLAHRLSMHEKYLVKCDFRTDYGKLFCEDRPILGDIVIIDDVVRTGRTISTVRQHFKTKYPDSAIFALCLVYVHSEVQENLDASIIDYHAWFATSPHISMPWSSRAEADPNAFFDDVEIGQLVGQIESSEVIDSRPLTTEGTTLPS